jgi:hypothetical protein
MVIRSKDKNVLTSEALKNGRKYWLAATSV